jgi:hypothetical protein
MGGRGHQSTRMTTARRSRSPSSSWSRGSVSIHTSTWIALADVRHGESAPRSPACLQPPCRRRGFRPRTRRTRAIRCRPTGALAPPPRPSALRPLEASTRDVAQLPVGFRCCSGFRRYGRAIAAVATWGRDSGRHSPHWTTSLDCAPERLRHPNILQIRSYVSHGRHRSAAPREAGPRRRDAEPPGRLADRGSSTSTVAGTVWQEESPRG